jgi:hypothetical protein
MHLFSGSAAEKYITENPPGKDEWYNFVDAMSESGERSWLIRISLYLARQNRLRS